MEHDARPNPVESGRKREGIQGSQDAGKSLEEMRKPLPAEDTSSFGFKTNRDEK
jgi:hypothetical protein